MHVALLLSNSDFLYMHCFVGARKHFQDEINIKSLHTYGSTFKGDVDVSYQLIIGSDT